MKLTDAEQRAVAQRANWFFDVYLGQNTGDSVVYTGDGVDDLNRVIELISSGTSRGARFLVDTSSGNFSNYRPFDLEDLQIIRSYFISWYGTVAKPDAYKESSSVALSQQSMQVVI